VKLTRTRTSGRRARLHTATISLLALALVAPAPAHAATGLTQRLIVGFRTGTGAHARSAGLRRAATKLAVRSYSAMDMPSLTASEVTVPAGQAVAVEHALEARSDVAWVEVDHVAHAFWNPGDPFLSQQWGLAKIGAYTAWDTARGSGEEVAVVDSGVNYDHEDLQGRVDKGWDFVDGDADPMDVNGHGTHVAGIAAASAGNGAGGSGVAPDARVLAVRVLDGDGSGYYSWIANGITYAADHGANVINLSLGGPQGSHALQEAIDYATARGVVVTCASGNDGVGKVSYPAAYPQCLSVGASTSADQRASFSNYGKGLDVVAPGQNIFSSTIDGFYDSWDGTSMATPFVSGEAAVLESQGLTRRQVVATIENTAHDIGKPGYDPETGYGRVDLAAAVAAAAQIGPAAADSEAPTVEGAQLGARVTTVSVTSSFAWRRTKVTRWKLYGTSTTRGTYAWHDVQNGAKVRRIYYYRLRAGKVRRRVVTFKRLRSRHQDVQHARLVTISATDNVAVDRVGLRVDGQWIGSDWSSSGGWAVPWQCTPGPHTMLAYAWDARNNETSREVSLDAVC
jgi:thermitase